MISEEISFADELRQRIEIDEEKVLYFLKVVDRGLEFPLRGLNLDYRRVAVVSNMILAVISEESDYVVARWHGPTLETDFKQSKTLLPYSESTSFILSVPLTAIKNGSVIRVNDWEVVKMANHVPAVLY